jgi:hypothetical protein
MLQLGEGAAKLGPPGRPHALLCGWLLLWFAPTPKDALVISASNNVKLSGGPTAVSGLPCPLLPVVLPLGLLLPLPVLLLNLIMNADRPAGADTRLLPLLSPGAACPDPAAAAAAAGLVTVGPVVLHRFSRLLPS